MLTSVSGRVAQALAPHVTECFGLMGNGNAYFLDALAATDVHFTPVRHEQGAVVAADAYVRAGGKLAVATTTYGPGYTNALTGLAEAEQAHIPLVLVVGDQPTVGPRAWDVDQVKMAEACGVKTFTVDTANAGAQTIAAIEHALANQTPVVVAIPYDIAGMASQELGPIPDLKLPERKPVAPSAIAEAVELLISAKRPVIIAGRGAVVAGAGEALGKLAERLGAVTGTSAIARSIFPDARYDLGVVGGFGHPDAMELIHSADVVLVVGAGLNMFTMAFGHLFGEDARVIQIDQLPKPTNPAVKHFISGDAKLALEAITNALGSGAPETEPGWRDKGNAIVQKGLQNRESGEELAGDGRLDPRALATELAALLPADRVVVSDGGHFISWANTHWPVAAPERMVMVGTAFQVIGQGFPSALGAHRAQPDSAVIVTTGDGGGLMALSDLESVINQVPSAVIVVWNDACYNAEVSLYGAFGLDQTPMHIPEVNFAAIGQALGARGAIVRKLSDLADFKQWVHDGAAGTYVIDARISPTIVSPHQVEIVAVNEKKHNEMLQTTRVL